MSTASMVMQHPIIISLVMLAAGILLGVLSGTGMSEGMAHWMINVLPEGSATWLHVIIGAFGVPLGMLFSPDAYYFALLPVIRDVAVAAGVDPAAVAKAMLIGENTGFGVSPVVPSVYLAIGLVGALVTGLLIAFPRELVLAIAGLALLGTIGGGLQAALQDDRHREAALITFLVTLSGVVVAGIGSAFWGVVAGALALFVQQYGLPKKA